MAEFDFKKLLKEGIKEKKTQRSLNEKQTDWYYCYNRIYGCDIKLEHNKCKGAKGCVNDLVAGGHGQAGQRVASAANLYNNTTVTHPKYFPSGKKADQEKRMRQSVVDAVMTIIDVAGPGASVTTAEEMKRILLGLKYWKEKGKLKEIEMIFKQKWGIDHGAAGGTYPFSKSSTPARDSGEAVKRAGPDNDGKAKCIEYGSCLAAFIKKETTFVYGTAGWDARQYIIGDDEVRGILKDREFNTDVGWSITDQEYKAKETFQVTAAKKAQKDPQQAEPNELQVVKKQIRTDIKKLGEPLLVKHGETRLAEGKACPPNHTIDHAGNCVPIKSEYSPAETAPDTSDQRLPSGKCVTTGWIPISDKKCGPDPTVAAEKTEIDVKYKKANKKYNWPGTVEQAKEFFLSQKSSTVAAKTVSEVPAAAEKKIEKKAADDASKKADTGIYIHTAKKGNNKLIIIIEPPGDTIHMKKIDMVRKKYPGRFDKVKEVWLGGFKQTDPPSVLNTIYTRILKVFKKRFSNYELTYTGIGLDKTKPIMEFKFSDVAEVNTAVKLINKNWKIFYDNSATKAWRGAQHLAGKSAKPGSGSWWQNLRAASAMSDKGSGEEFRDPRYFGKNDPRNTGTERRMPVEENKQLKFGDTISGKRNKKLSESLLNEKKEAWERAALKFWRDSQKDRRSSDDDEFAELDELERPARQGKISSRQAKAMIKKYEKDRKAAGDGFGLDDWAYLHYGSKTATQIFGNPAVKQAAKKTGVTRTLATAGADKIKATWTYSKNFVRFAGKQHRAIGTFGQGARLTKAGEYTSRGVQWFTRGGGARLGSTAGQIGARTATSAGLSNLTHVAGASAGQIVAAVGVGAAVGTAIGWSINKMISGDLEEDRKKRLLRAKNDPKFANYELEVLCTGKGTLCTGFTGRGAPDGWQVKCTGQRGGYEYETGEGGLGYDPGYADPNGPRDRIQVANSYDKKDMEDAILFLSFLFEDDKKSGYVKDHFEEEEKGKSYTGKIQLQDGSKLKTWEGCWKGTMERYAAKTLETSTDVVKEAYVTIQHAFGLPVVKIAFERGKAAKTATALASLGGKDKKKEKEKAKNMSDVNKVQSALIKYYGKEFADEIADEYSKSVYGPKTKAKLLEFKTKYRAQMPLKPSADEFAELVDYIIEYENVYGKDFDSSRDIVDPDSAASISTDTSPVPERFSAKQIGKYLVSQNLVASATDPKAKEIIDKLMAAQSEGQELDFKKIDLVARTIMTENIYIKRLSKLNKRMFKTIN